MHHRRAVRELLDRGFALRRPRIKDPVYPDEARKRIHTGAVVDENGCWVWQRYTGPEGYGRSRLHGKKMMAHQVSYFLFKGPVPDGLVIDHICRVRACVNPDHLRAITQLENTMIGEGVCARNARKTHCPQGHVYSGENLYVLKVGKGRTVRICRACHRRRSQQWKATKKDAA